jgi:pilus assembly protein CpaF
MPKSDLTKALGPIAPLLDDPEVLEIMVDGPDHITFQKQGEKIQDAKAHFKSNNEVKDAIKAVLNSVGVMFEEDKAIYDARLSDNSRMLAVLSPAAVNGHSIVFRKFSARQVTWEKLLEYRAVTPEVRDLIQSALDAHVNILIAGGTASGKTTFANRIIELISPDERVVAVEQTHEFQFEHPRAVFLEADASLRAGMNDLLTAGSKMRGDWLVVGELLGAEALRAMQLFSNGHSGITTIHASSAENALTRLEAMCLMANLGLGLDDIREMIASALKLVLYQECLVRNGKRKVTQISELRGLENGRYILQPLMRYNPDTDQFEWTGIKPEW